MAYGWLRSLLAVLLSYALGDILFAWVVGNLLYHTDVRQHGSKNLGGTNVLRTLGPTAAILVLVGDVGKGVLAVWLGGRLSGHNLGVMMLCGIAVVAGHNWPVFLHFRGGRGIGTSLGVLLGLMPASALVLAIVFLAVVALSRYVSLGSICAALVFPPTAFLLYRYRPGFPLYLVTSLVVTALALYRHIPNMRRLLQGKEFKLGQRVEVNDPKGEGEESKQR